MVNLDDETLDPKELRTMAKVFRDQLARYARKKAEAMGERRRGNIQAAELCERDCENIYQALPDWAKW